LPSEASTDMTREMEITEGQESVKWDAEDVDTRKKNRGDRRLRDQRLDTHQLLLNELRHSQANIDSAMTTYEKESIRDGTKIDKLLKDFYPNNIAKQNDNASAVEPTNNKQNGAKELSNTEMTWVDAAVPHNRMHSDQETSGKPGFPALIFSILILTLDAYTDRVYSSYPFSDALQNTCPIDSTLELYFRLFLRLNGTQRGRLLSSFRCLTESKDQSGSIELVPVADMFQHFSRRFNLCISTDIEAENVPIHLREELRKGQESLQRTVTQAWKLWPPGSEGSMAKLSNKILTVVQETVQKVQSYCSSAIQ
jgi:hypothetical protein